MQSDPQPNHSRETEMAILNIRNLPDHVHARLRIRAAEHGRSMEAEARAILAAACGSDAPAQAAASIADIQAWVDRIYGHDKPEHVVDDMLADRRREAAREWSS